MPYLGEHPYRRKICSAKIRLTMTVPGSITGTPCNTVGTVPFNNFSRSLNRYLKQQQPVYKLKLLVVKP